MQPCPECGASFEPVNGGYSAAGAIVCADCASRARAAASEAESKAKGSALVGAAGSLLIALASFLVEHRLIFFLLPLMALSGGALTSFAALTNQEVGAALGWKRWPTVGLGVLATLLALLSLAV